MMAVASLTTLASLLNLANLRAPGFVGRAYGPLSIRVTFLGPVADLTLLAATTVGLAALTALKEAKAGLLIVPTVLIYVLAPRLLPLAALAALVYYAKAYGLGEAAKGFVTGLIGLELCALARWLIYPVYPNPPYAEITWRPAWDEAALFFALNILSPYLVTGLFLSWVPALIKALRRREVKARKEGRGGLGALCLALLASASVAAYPLLPTVNPGVHVGVDVPSYIYTVRQIVDKPDLRSFVRACLLGEGVKPAFYNYKYDRPLFLFLTSSFLKLTGIDVDLFFDLLPLFLAPFFVLAVYYLIKGYVGEATMKLALMLAATSYVITVGIYAGFYANWLGLSVGLLYLRGLVDLLEAGRPRGLAATIAASLSCLLIHPYTWIVLSAVALVYLLISLRWIRLKGLLVGLGVLAASASLPLAYDAFRLASGARYSLVWDVFWRNASIGLKGYISLSYWDSLIRTLHVYVSGFISNPYLLLASAAGVLTARGGNPLERLLLAWTAVGLALALPLPTSMQIRVIYDYPCYLAAALGLARCLRGDVGLRRTALYFFLLANLNYALRCAANVVAPT